MGRTIVTGMVILVWSAALSFGADWNQWRGPNRDGTAPDSPPLAESWGPAGPPKLWASEKIMDGREDGLGSVSIAGGKTYVLLNWKPSPSAPAAPADPAVPMLLIVCLDGQGKTLWKREYPDPSNSTPCIVNGRCYAAGARTLYCLDANSGKEIWKTPLKRKDVASSPLVADGVVVILGGRLMGLDAKTGQPVWQANLEGCNPSPVLWTFGGKKYVLCNTFQGLACVEATSGQVLWRTQGGGNGTVVVSDNIAILLGIGQKLGLVAYRLSAEKAEQRWSVPIMDRGSTPVIYKGCVYVVGANQAACYGLDKGDLKWQQKFQCEITSPLVADGKVFGLVENSNNLLMLRASPEKYELLGKFLAGANICASPSICDGKLYLRAGSGVVCYDLRKH